MWMELVKKTETNNTKFIPVDPEHFSIWYALKNNKNKIKKYFNSFRRSFYKFTVI